MSMAESFWRELLNNSQGNQIKKSNESYSSWEKRPKNFSIYFSVIFFLFWMVIDFASYADENTLYNACENVDAVVQSFRM